MRSQPATPATDWDATDDPGLENLMVAEVLQRWPGTLPVFIRYRLACVGCLMARFERLTAVPHIYGLDAQRFLREVAQAAQSQENAR